MPFYGYKCESIVKADNSKDQFTCGHEYEVFFTSVARAEAEEPSEACPVCGGLEKRRLVAQGTTHVLKGKGWFKDGY